jgi:hypothetical protein
MPMKETLLPSACAILAIAGISVLQTLHDDDQKLRTTGLPWSRDSRMDLPPERRGKLKAKAGRLTRANPIAGADFPEYFAERSVEYDSISDMIATSKKIAARIDSESSANFLRDPGVARHFRSRMARTASVSPTSAGSLRESSAVTDSARAQIRARASRLRSQGKVRVASGR